MQTSTGFADRFGEARLDVHVNVFEGRIERQRVLFEGSQNRAQSTFNGLRIGAGENAASGEHARVGDGSGNVVRQ